MIVEQKALTDIKPYIKNPRKKWDIQKVAQSIKEFGFQQPIVVDRGGTIIVGHGRYEAAKLLKLTSIPVTIADLPPDKAKAYRIADNKTNEFSEWDISLLQQEFTDLLDANFDLELTGFDHDELESLITGEKAGLTDDDAVPELPDEPKSKLGDIYKLGEHRLMCGDSTKIDDTDKLIKNIKIDLVYTDPPYGINEKGDRSERGGLTQGNKLKDFKDDSIQYAVDSYNICEGVYKIPRQVWWGANYYCHHLPQSNNWFVWDKRVEEKQKDTQSDCELAWVKSKWSSVRIFRHLWKGMMKGSEKGQRRVHPTQKPVALAEWSLDYFKEFETVLDLFGGSGSTLLACEKKKKKCFMMEFDPHYVDVIIKRWEDYTGKKAELLNG
jgi:site-specific DNA-methyltransferase (adenine-specific)